MKKNKILQKLFWVLILNFFNINAQIKYFINQNDFNINQGNWDTTANGLNPSQCDASFTNGNIRLQCGDTLRDEGIVWNNPLNTTGYHHFTIQIRISTFNSEDVDRCGIWYSLNPNSDSWGDWTSLINVVADTVLNSEMTFSMDTEDISDQSYVGIGLRWLGTAGDEGCDVHYVSVHGYRITDAPTANPTLIPSVIPTNNPTEIPTTSPTTHPTISPTLTPTNSPTMTPTIAPSLFPTSNPTHSPTLSPTIIPSLSPTLTPNIFPTSAPSTAPTGSPTLGPSVETQNILNISNIMNISTTTVKQPTKSPSTEPTLNPTIETPLTDMGIENSDTQTILFLPVNVFILIVAIIFISCLCILILLVISFIKLRQKKIKEAMNLQTTIAKRRIQTQSQSIPKETTDTLFKQTEIIEMNNYNNFTVTNPRKIIPPKPSDSPYIKANIPKPNGSIRKHANPVYDTDIDKIKLDDHSGKPAPNIIKVQSISNDYMNEGEINTQNTNDIIDDDIIDMDMVTAL